MAPPYVVKPLNEGSSVGVWIVQVGDVFEPRKENWVFGDRVMVERFIPGRELTVTVMGDRPLAVTEVMTRREFYDYDAKYIDGGSKHIVPADIPKAIYEEALHISLLAHKSLECRGISRVDIRYDGKNLYVLEVNTQPGMTPTSLVPEQAAYLNISFNELVIWLVENAVCDA
jgi:D-alanine-D-alanine ligase